MRDSISNVMFAPSCAVMSAVTKSRQKQARKQQGSQSETTSSKQRRQTRVLEDPFSKHGDDGGHE